jgi:hypothetical protein
MLYTFFASKPAGSYRSPYPEDEVALAEIRRMLERAPVPDDTVFVPVSTVGEIAGWFAQRGLAVTASDHLQIVGHATPGVLHLGSLWTGEITNAARTAVYALDCNAIYHGVLADCVEPGATVWIVGCSVGNDRFGTDDGATLLFDLARMWRCTVHGPAWAVGPDDFDPQTRRFKATNMVVTAAGRAVSPVPPRPAKRLGGDPLVLEVASLERIRLGTFAGYDAQRNERLNAAARANLSGLKLHRVEPRPVPGLAEVEVRLANGKVAAFLAHGTCILQDADDGTWEHFAAEDARDLQCALHSLLAAIPRG